jgi:DNA-binding winged helix-turn-helix (wHTH) protein/Tfp pilus assembly protein PilF
MPNGSREIYEFGSFRLNVVEHLFERIDGTQSPALPEKAFQTLTLLVRNNGRLLTKEELLSNIWPDTIVEENNLDKAIHAVRVALGETSKNTKYIQTVRKHGYRFVADVKRIDAEVVTDAIQLQNANGTSERSPSITRRSRVGMSQFALYMVLLAGVLAIGAFLFASGDNPDTTGTSGSNSKDDRGTSSDQAYALYKQANASIKGRSNQQNLRASIERLEEATSLDQSYAAAHALLARKRIELSNLVEDPTENCEKARIAVAKALELDEDLAEGYLALALQNHRCDWDFEGAGRAFRRALELKPNSVDVLSNYAVYLNTMGDTDAALANMERALQFDPSSDLNQHIYGILLYFARRYDDSISRLKFVAEQTNGAMGGGWIWLACDMKGDQPQALEWYINSQVDPNDKELAELLHKIYRSGGWQAIRMHQLETESSNPSYTKGKYYRMARIFTLIGNKDQAFIFLEKALDRRDAQLLMLKQEPAFDGLRSDERYAALLSRIGFDS